MVSTATITRLACAYDGLVEAVARLRAIRAIADHLSSLTRAEVVAILQLAGTTHDIPSYWDSTSARSNRDDVITLLSQFWDDERLLLLLQLVSPEEGSVGITAPEGSKSIEGENSGSIFVVHGHARAVLHEAVRVLERGTGRDVIVLHEQANGGRTILEKFEDHATGAAFAVVLLTGDDEGGVRTGERTQPRGRQNVIFEFGFFFGKLGRQRVAVLLEAGVEKPSDIDGLVYISLDQHGAWKQSLAKELENAGIQVDRSRIP